MQGFDGPLQGALQLQPLQLGQPVGSDPTSPLPSPPTAAAERGMEWKLLVGKMHANSFNSIHGGCTAALIDVLGRCRCGDDVVWCGLAMAVCCVVWFGLAMVWSCGGCCGVVRR